MENRYPPHHVCQVPCTTMNIKLALKSNSKVPGRSRITFVLYKDIEVVSEVMSKSGLMVIAEIGGYLGLTLGISLLDLKFLICLQKCWPSKPTN